MFKKIKKILFKVAYALPFGLKSADAEIMGGSDSSLANGIEINQQVTDKTVAKHLLKGEVTQAVEELRYRTYKVEEESNNYEYLGNGVAIKKEKEKKQLNKSKFKFTQRNKLIVSGVLEEMERIDSYGKDNYALEIMYSSYPRFRMEEFADRIIVDANTNTEQYKTTLVFSTIPNKFNTASKPFVIELLKLTNIPLDSEYAVSHNELLSSLSSISFSTYKADNEEDFTNYSFLGTCKVDKVELSNNECFITYNWSEMLRVPLGKLSDKYFSKTMSDKYENVTEKEVDTTLEEVKKTYHCTICGKEYTESIVPDICDECFKKMSNK